MAIKHILGDKGPFHTQESKHVRERESHTYVVEGQLQTLLQSDPKSFVKGVEVVEHNVEPTNDGLGKMLIKTVGYDSGNADAIVPTRSTLRIDMVEVQYDLEDHPYFKGTYRNLILKWLATDPSVRISGDDKSGFTYYFTNSDGTLHEISDERTLQFIAAYNAGIKTFVRYYPVIDKISTYKNPPGMSRTMRSFTGGSPKFSFAGGWESPPVTLNDYPKGNWFKSKDTWVEKENTTWERTEQWTFTPEGSDGPHSWIYKAEFLK